MKNRIKKFATTIKSKWYMNYYIQYEPQNILYIPSFEETNLYVKYRFYLIKIYEKYNTKS